MLNILLRRDLMFIREFPRELFIVDINIDKNIVFVVYASILKIRDIL